MKNELLKLIYKYYPSNILGLNEEYNETEESQNMINLLEGKISKNYNSWCAFKDKLNNKFQPDVLIVDKTTFFINQPSFGMQLSKLGYDQYYHIYFSFFIPYFYVSKIEDQNEKTIEVEQNPNRMFDIKISELVQLFKSEFEIELFPKELLNTRVPNVSFELFKFGEFTFQKALFNSHHIII